MDWLDSLKLIPVYLLFMGTFGPAAWEKWTSGGVPDWFQNQFSKTFLRFAPGGFTIPYYKIALLETSVFVLFGLSALSGEFLPGRDPVFLRWALVLALFTFFALGFGLRIAGDYQGAANLFSYFGVSFLVFVYVEKFLNLGS